MYLILYRMKYSIKYIILQQDVLNRELLKNDKEKIVDFFLENVWSGKTQLYYDIEKKINLNKLYFHKSVPQELKNITRVFYAWSVNIDKEYLNDMIITKVNENENVVNVELKVKSGKVKVNISRVQSLTRQCLI
jgi:hypothetical protein